MKVFSSSLPPPFPVIMGPTASGKSFLALQLAEKYDGEIISADSMQIYKGLDVGTAKPTKEERAKIPHHLLDIIDITEKYDVFAFRDAAEKAVKEIRERGKLPVIAGGTGLYMRAIMYGLDELPSSPELRKSLDEKYDNEEKFPELVAIMEEKAPADAEAFRSHRRKLIRAYEVLLLTGKEMTFLQQAWKREPRKDAQSFVLVWENSVLKERIALRCRQMLESSWIEEAESFIKNGLLSSPTAWQVLGYRQIGQYLAGMLKKEELFEKISIATWQYARRQNTWFRTQHPEAIRISMQNKNSFRDAERVVMKFSAKE
ncbi:MAG: tRNA (adenosine(37)-N6)-dimethylallyltransferase MiaA [Lentisphaeria bacterium]|nr:tRNA (adenosine(37)-N6)-dimethylallyltransferase MiaA [Lentisphaeria bacterium]